MHYHHGLLSWEIESYVELTEANIAVCLRCLIMFCPSGCDTPSHKYEALIRSYHAYKSVNEWDENKLMHPASVTP